MGKCIPGGSQSAGAASETLLEKVIKVIAVASSAVPFAGGPTSLSLGYWLQEQERKRWQEYWASIEQKAQELDTRKVDQEFIASPEFVLRLQEIYAEVTRTADDEKLKYLRNYLLSCLWRGGSDVGWRGLFWNHVRRMSGAHLTILEFFYRRQGHLSYSHRFNLPQRGDDAPLGLDDCVRRFRRFDENLVTMLLADLASFGLIAAWRPGAAAEEGWSLTDAGLSLMRFLSVQWDLRPEQG